MYERFTDRARRVMVLANQEAQRVGHELVGELSLLTGIVKEGSGNAARILKDRIDLKGVRDLQSLGISSGQIIMGRLPRDETTKQIIATAIEQAKELRHNYVGTDHLLFGILKHAENDAARLLASKGVTLEGAKSEFFEMTGNPAGDNVKTSAWIVGVTTKAFMAAAEAEAGNSITVGTPFVSGFTFGTHKQHVCPDCGSPPRDMTTPKQSYLDETQGDFFGVPTPAEQNGYIVDQLQKLTKAVADLQASVKPAPMLVKVKNQEMTVGAMDQLSDQLKDSSVGEVLVMGDDLEVISPTGYRVETEVDGMKKAFEAPTLADLRELIAADKAGWNPEPIAKFREASFTQGIRPDITDDTKAMASRAQDYVVSHYGVEELKEISDRISRMKAEHPGTDDQPPDDDQQPTIVDTR